MSVLLRLNDSFGPLPGCCLKQYGERRANTQRARNFKPTAMAIENVLDDRQAEPGTAEFARARGVDPVEALCETRQMLARDAFAAIGDGEADEGTCRRQPLRGARGDRDGALRLAVFDRVVDQVLEHLGKLVLIAVNIGKIVGKDEVEAHAALGSAQFE